MSHKGNDMYNDHLKEDYEEALVIIANSLNMGRELTYFKRWEHLEPEARIQAIADSFKTCDMCLGKFHNSKIQIAEQNMYGDYFECRNCASRRAII